MATRAGGGRNGNAGEPTVRLCCPTPDDHMIEGSGTYHMLSEQVTYASGVRITSMLIFIGQCMLSGQSCCVLALWQNVRRVAKSKGLASSPLLLLILFLQRMGPSCGRRSLTVCSAGTRRTTAPSCHENHSPQRSSHPFSPQLPGGSRSTA